MPEVCLKRRDKGGSMPSLAVLDNADQLIAVAEHVADALAAERTECATEMEDALRARIRSATIACGAFSALVESLPATGIPLHLIVPTKSRCVRSLRVLRHQIEQALDL